MPERVGFDRKICRAWLDLTAEVVCGTVDPAAVNVALNQALSTKIRGSDARRKNINLLTRIWLRVPEAHRPLRDEALTFWPDLTGEERLWLHWGLSLLAYPFFRDVAATVGRLLYLQETFTAGQVHREIVASWGERTTLQYAVRRAISSLAEWGVLKAGKDGRGPYTAVPPLTPPNPELPLWLLEAALRARRVDAMPLYNLQRLPELFPFDLDVGVSTIHRSRRFLIVWEGGDTEMVVLREQKRR